MTEAGGIELGPLPQRKPPQGPTTEEPERPSLESLKHLKEVKVGMVQEKARWCFQFAKANPGQFAEKVLAAAVLPLNAVPNPDDLTDMGSHYGCPDALGRVYDTLSRCGPQGEWLKASFSYHTFSYHTRTSACQPQLRSCRRCL